jgi:hypothetical protein
MRTFPPRFWSVKANALPSTADPNRLILLPAIAIGQQPEFQYNSHALHNWTILTESTDLSETRKRPGPPIPFGFQNIQKIVSPLWITWVCTDGMMILEPWEALNLIAGRTWSFTSRNQKLFLGFVLLYLSNKYLQCSLHLGVNPRGSSDLIIENFIFILTLMTCVMPRIRTQLESKRRTAANSRIGCGHRSKSTLAPYPHAVLIHTL